MAMRIFFNPTSTSQIYTLSLHDALPISPSSVWTPIHLRARWRSPVAAAMRDRKSTRLNSSHPSTSYAVFCLKKKKRVYCDPIGPHAGYLRYGRQSVVDAYQAAPKIGRGN